MDKDIQKKSVKHSTNQLMMSFTKQEARPMKTFQKVFYKMMELSSHCLCLEGHASVSGLMKKEALEAMEHNLI